MFGITYATLFSVQLIETRAWIRLVGVVGMVAMTPFKSETLNADMYGLIMMVFFHSVFLAQGTVD